MPQISATVRQPVVDAINAQAKQEKRSFSEMVAVLLEKSLKNNAIKKRYVETNIRLEPLPIKRTTATNIRGDKPGDTVQQ